MEWPCGNCGATEEFGPGGCSERPMVTLTLNPYCGSYRAEMGVHCSCDYGMDRRDDVFVCRNCPKRLTLDEVRALVAKYGEAITALAGTLAREGEVALTPAPRCATLASGGE